MEKADDLILKAISLDIYEIRTLLALNIDLKEKNKKLKFMIDNGLGWEDMKNDITYPHEL